MYPYNMSEIYIYIYIYKYISQKPLNHVCDFYSQNTYVKIVCSYLDFSLKLDGSQREKLAGSQLEIRFKIGRSSLEVSLKLASIQLVVSWRFCMKLAGSLLGISLKLAGSLDAFIIIISTRKISSKSSISIAFCNNL